MKKRKINRLGHEGKTFQEKEVYKKFLYSKFDLEKTEPSPIDTDKTNESSFDEDETPTVPKKTKKSSWLKLKDFLSSNWVVSFIVGIMLIILSGYISTMIRQGIQKEQIVIIQEDIKEVKLDFEKIEEESKNEAEKSNSFRETINIFKIEISKDLEYIKKRIDLIN